MTAENPLLVKSSTDNRALLAAATIGGLIAGGLLAFFLLGDGAGDEPPIRVKNRSIEFELVRSGGKWREIAPNDKMHWRISGGGKNRPDFEIYVAPSDITKCPGGIFKSGSTLAFAYGDGTTADIEVTIASDVDDNTTLTSTKPLEYGKKPNGSDDRKIVLYKGNSSHFIQQISIGPGGSSYLCKFGTKDNALSAHVVEAGS
jgi:hypothetical protein